jgi:hypothetical protein
MILGSDLELKLNEVYELFDDVDGLVISYKIQPLKQLSRNEAQKQLLPNEFLSYDKANYFYEVLIIKTDETIN